MTPKMFKIRQRFRAEKLGDVRAALRDELSTHSLKPGARIAIAVGSRGIANLALIVGEVVTWVKANGGEPFIVPAMGSHGGATADGQQKILENFGLSGIVSSMETVQLGPDAFIDRQAFESDGVILINRVKPHTSFHGRYESGLMKMLAVGLSKHAGAVAIHRQGVAGLRERIPIVARQILATGKILFGVAIVENACDETMLVRATATIVEDEPALLELARAHVPTLPVEELDLLIVDEIGKEISGTGMDSNVIGRMRIDGEPEPATPRIKRIFVRDLRGDSAYGIGLADVTTRRLVEKADWNATKINAETSGFLRRAEIPEIVERDEAIVGANRGRKAAPTTASRIIRIKNTLQLDTLIVSEPVLKEIEGRNSIEVVGPAGIWDAW